MWGPQSDRPAGGFNQHIHLTMQPMRMPTLAGDMRMVGGLGNPAGSEFDGGGASGSRNYTSGSRTCFIRGDKRSLLR